MIANAKSRLKMSGDISKSMTSPSGISSGDVVSATTKQRKTESTACDSDDLNQCIKDILAWEMCLMNLNTKVHDLLEENKTLKRQMESMKTTRVSDRKSIADLQEVVKSLQDVLKKRFDQKDELQALREQLLKQKEKTVEAELKLEADQKKFKESLQMQMNKSTNDTLKLKEKLNEQYAQTEKEYNERIQNLDKELSTERETRQEMEERHENEIVKMQMKYENKLALVQAQNNRLQSNQTALNFGNNEVFRKKLQHIQEESSKEISHLKQEITVLKFKLDTKLQNKENPSSVLPPNGRTGILKRRRF